MENILELDKQRYSGGDGLKTKAASTPYNQ